VLEPELAARLVSPLRGGGGRRTYHLARLEADAETGELGVRPVASRGSGDVLALARAHAFIVTPEDGPHEVAAGATVRVLAWRDWGLAAV
jgi:molybdopterin biosynthesis enzyme